MAGLHYGDGLIAFGDQLGEVGNVVVALDQRGTRPDPGNDLGIEGPDGVADRRVVGVDQQRLCVDGIGRKAGQMDLADEIGRNGRQIVPRVGAEIVGADVHIVEIKQQATACRGGQFDQEVNLPHLVAFQVKVQGRILDQQASAQCVLRAPDVVADPLQHLSGARKREQIRMIDAAAPRPGQMLGHQKRLEPVSERLEPRQMHRVRRLVSAERQPDTMKGQRLFSADGLQPFQARAAIDHIVLGMDLEPQTGRRRRQSLVVMAGLEAQSHSGDRRRGGRSMVHQSSSDQRETGVREPLPRGVRMLVQVPAGVCFQALP